MVSQLERADKIFEIFFSCTFEVVLCLSWFEMKEDFFYLL